MEYLISTITDVDYEENMDSFSLGYTQRTAPIAQKYGLGLELAEFCISENMEIGFDNVLPHVEANAAAVKRKTLHAPYNELFPMAIDPRIVEVAYERYDAAWGYALRFGADKMIVHANYVEDLYFPSWFIERHVLFWNRFLDKHPENITICIENVMEKKPDMLVEIIKEVNNPRLRMCLDVGHANLSEVAPYEWLLTCAPYISHYHIHNNNGPVDEGHRSIVDRHQALDKGSIDMLTLIRTAEELTPHSTAAIESYYPEACAAWLLEHHFIQQ